VSAVIAYVLLAVVAGFCLPTQAGINAQLNLVTRSPILAATISFAVGTLALVVYALILRIPLPSAAAATRTSWWVWSGGVLGAFFVTATVILAPRLGAASMVALIVAGQMIMSIFLDHFGLLGYPLHPMNWPRLAGVCLMVGGVAMIRWF
jgi:transporter family-2 protein